MRRAEFWLLRCRYRSASARRWRSPSRFEGTHGAGGTDPPRRQDQKGNFNASNENGPAKCHLDKPRTGSIFDTSNHTQDTIPACISCGTTNIEEIGYSEGAPVWRCAHGHLSHEVEDIAVMPEYVLAALAELAADYGPYDFPGDTIRDESGRAA
jgi:hypothetical protein